MNFKRGRPKSARAGCKMCKPQKLGRGLEHKAGWNFGALRAAYHSARDLREYDQTSSVHRP